MDHEVAPFVSSYGFLSAAGLLVVVLIILVPIIAIWQSVLARSRRVQYQRRINFADTVVRKKCNYGE